MTSPCAAPRHTAKSKVRRVPVREHTANLIFAVCFCFAECFVFYARHIDSSPCAWEIAHGKPLGTRRTRGYVKLKLAGRQGWMDDDDRRRGRWTRILVGRWTKDGTPTHPLVAIYRPPPAPCSIKLSGHAAAAALSISSSLPAERHSIIFIIIYNYFDRLIDR